MNKDGDFEISSIASIILIVLMLVALILFIYLGRERIKEYVDIILEFLRI